MPYYTFYEDKDCGGNDYIGHQHFSVAQECADLCDSKDDCVAFVFQPESENPNCHCKNICNHLQDLDDCNTYKRGKFSDILD